MGLNKGMSNPKSFGINILNPVSFGIMLQESGIRLQGALCSIIDNFTVLLFYFFKKKKYWNIGTFR